MFALTRRSPSRGFLRTGRTLAGLSIAFHIIGHVAVLLLWHAFKHLKYFGLRTVSFRKLNEVFLLRGKIYSLQIGSYVCKGLASNSFSHDFNQSRKVQASLHRSKSIKNSRTKRNEA